MPDMELADLVVHTTTREPIAILVEPGTDRCLVIFLRAPQAEVIAGGLQPRRDAGERLTQDVVADVVAALGRRLARVEITGLEDGVFAADLVLDDDTRVTVRPSDGLALAVREGLGLGVADAVLDEAGQSYQALRGDREDPPHEQVRAWREALEDATVEDFRSVDEG